MNPISKALIVGGIILIVSGLLWQFGSKLGLGKLPGDIAIEKENFKFYFPITTSILISLLLTLISWLFRK